MRAFGEMRSGREGKMNTLDRRGRGIEKSSEEGEGEQEDYEENAVDFV